MRTLLWAVILVVVAGLTYSGQTWADDKSTQAILDKAIKALGGEDKLSQTKAATWKYQGKITFDSNESEFTSTLTVQGLDHIRAITEFNFNGRKFKGVTVIAKNKGWRKTGDRTMEIGENELADQKRGMYIEVIPTMIVLLKDKGFKVEAAGEKRIGDNPAVGLKVTGPEGKDFRLYLNKDSGLPIMLTAKFAGSEGKEYTEETTFADYKEFAGIKKAIKVVAKRNGEKYLEAQITEFKVLDKVDPKTFDEPK